MKTKEFQERVKAMAEVLEKFEPGVGEALNAVREAVKAGHLDPKHAEAITRAIAVDTRIPVMGNAAAYDAFKGSGRAVSRGGVHIRMDANDFGRINKLYGDETGNQAIFNMGTAMREAMDEAVGRKHGKLFRVGGDEFHAHVPSHEHAARFARVFRQKLQALPPTKGTHGYSMSMGFGHDADTAMQAVIHAKQSKNMAKYPEGKAQTHVHSLVPGHEGAVPVDSGMTPASMSNWASKP